MSLSETCAQCSRTVLPSGQEVENENENENAVRIKEC
jgi:hypothetical protein